MTKKRIVRLAVSVLSVAVLAACNNNKKSQEEEAKVYTYHEFLTVSPSNWNELTYQDNNDTEIMSFISGSFFSYNFKFDANGKPIDGEFVVQYDGAKKLEDVTSARSPRRTRASSPRPCAGRGCRRRPSPS